MSHFETALKHTLGIEGAYSDHPADSGGATMYGITEALARRYGYQGPMHRLPLSEATRIYRAAFWDALHLDEVATLAPQVAYEMFDSAVNVGTDRAVRWLQRALNVLNQQGRLYADLTEDGDLGPKTLAALQAYLWHRGTDGERVLLRALNSLQGAFYIELAERRQKDEVFVFGWLLHRVT